MLYSVRKCEPPLLTCNSANNPATLAAGSAAEPSQTCSVAVLQYWGVAETDEDWDSVGRGFDPCSDSLDLP